MHSKVSSSKDGPDSDFQKHITDVRYLTRSILLAISNWITNPRPKF